MLSLGFYIALLNGGIIFFGLLDALITLWYVILQEETHTVMKLTTLPNIPADSFYSGEKN